MGELAIAGGKPVRSDSYPRWPEWSEQERERLLEVLESGHWWATGGTRVPEFERAFAAFNNVGDCVAVTNGTHAIEVALMAAGLGEGDEVIVTDYTFFASAAAVLFVNAIPVLVDIDPDTFCIDPAAVEAAITKRTRAVVAVHVAGHPADLDRLVEICRRHDLALIEDCAHAHGSTWKDVPVGSIGDVGTFSFQESKLMTAGEGGAIVVSDPILGERVRSFADCGRLPGEWFYSHYALGGNYRMTEWQGAVLLSQLDRFPDQNRARNENALWLNDELARIPGVYPQARDERCTSQGYYCYIVRIDEEEFGATRDQTRKALIGEGIPMAMSYPAVHTLDAFATVNGFAPRLRNRSGLPDYANLDLPESMKAARTTLWFPHQVLMGDRRGVSDVAEAMHKVSQHAHELRDPG